MTRYINIEENVDVRRKAMKAPTPTIFSTFKRKRSRKFKSYTPSMHEGRQYSRRLVI